MNKRMKQKEEGGGERERTLELAPMHEAMKPLKFQSFHRG